MSASKPSTIKILGVNFNNAESKQVVQVLKNGGLLVVPSAPGLASIPNDHVYYHSLLNADFVLADSGYMSLIWNFTHRSKINRISGLEFLVDFFADDEVKQTKEIILVDPYKTESDANINYLNSIGFSLTQENSYVAPMYDKDDVRDDELLRLIADKKPKFILINLGGGIQEKLGAFLKNNLSYKPTIICTGAAIAFLTGHQAHIPNWADKLFIGWLFRCIEKPQIYVPRYFSSFKLLPIMLRHNSEMPITHIHAPQNVEANNQYQRTSLILD
jgi:N-acetylglucosaminyldiphosphoundecaprenol N-acetyl-beta-D-mannosaminyltransferase